MSVLQRLADDGKGLERRLFDFHTDLQAGIPEYEARGVMQYDVDSWVEATHCALIDEFGAESELAKKFAVSLASLRTNLADRPKQDQKSYVATYMYGLRELLQVAATAARLAPTAPPGPEKSTVNNVTINLGDGASFTGPVNVGENIRVSYQAAHSTSQDDKRELLEQLVKQVITLAEALESDEEKRDASSALEALVNEAKKDSPSKPVISGMAEQILEIAGKVGAVTEPIAATLASLKDLILG